MRLPHNACWKLLESRPSFGVAAAGARVTRPREQTRIGWRRVRAQRDSSRTVTGGPVRTPPAGGVIRVIRVTASSSRGRWRDGAHVTARRTHFNRISANPLCPAHMLKWLGAMSKGPPVVAIVNTNPDLVKILRYNLERTGFVVFEIHIEDIRLGAASVDSILEQHDPRVIVYDIAPPYDMNWRFLDHLRSSTGFKGRQFVLTSVNARNAADLVGNDESVYEILGENHDILEVVRAVKEASRARPTR